MTESSVGGFFIAIFGKPIGKKKFQTEINCSEKFSIINQKSSKKSTIQKINN
jgi:hypothetical protein